jgi:hypothetical protein
MGVVSALGSEGRSGDHGRDRGQRSGSEVGEGADLWVPAVSEKRKKIERKVREGGSVGLLGWLGSRAGPVGCLFPFFVLLIFHFL